MDEVISGGSRVGEVFDIAALEDEHLDYSLNLKVVRTCKISISYDVHKLDDIQAGQFMQLVKMYLDDPDMLLL